MRNVLLLITLGALLQFSLSCSELPAVPATGCGNRLIEPSVEDCDGLAEEPTARCAGPGEAHACRYVCVDSAGKGFACPAGYACGVDGVCRLPSGSFQQVGRSVETAASSLQAADFDDNKQAEILALGSSDVLGRVPSRVVFFSGDAEQATTQAIPGLLGAPVVGRFADSPYDGIAFGALPGVAMLIGRRDRQFFPRSYPSFQGLPTVTTARLYAFDILPTTKGPGGELRFLGDEPLVFASLGGGHQLVSAGETAEPVLAVLPAGPEEILGDVLAGKLDEGMACPTLIFPFRNAGSIQLLTPCESNGKGGFRLVAGAIPKDLPLSPGLQLRTRPVLADIDQDGHLDLLVGASEAGDAGALTVVSYGDGAGGLHVQPGGVGPAGFSLFTLPRAQVLEGCGVILPPGEIGDPELAEFLKDKALVPAPLAAGDLDGDGRVDLVFPYGICTSRDLTDPGGPPLYRPIAGPLGGLWTEALLVDLNGDGRPDVVGSPGESRALDLFIGSAQGLFNTTTIPLNGSASFLNAGDFDGDGSVDVVFRERGVQGTSNVGAATGDAVTVLFTAPKQIPSQLARVGRFEEILHLAEGTIQDVLSVDSISDIGVISRPPPPPEDPAAQLSPSISLFFGSPDRALRSPLTLQDTRVGKPDDLALPTLLTPGRFTPHGSQAQQDLIAVGVGEDAAPSAALTCPDDATSRPGRGLRFWLIVLGGDAQLRGVFPGPLLDLGGTGGFDFDCASQGQLGAGDLDSDGFDEALFAAPVAATTRVFVARSKGVAGDPETLPPLTYNFRLADGGRPLVLDADGDGRRDALLLAQQEDGAAQLAVLWGKGDGSFEEAPSLLALPGQQLRGFCGARAADGRSEVLLLGDEGLLRLGRTRQLEAKAVEQFTGEQLGGVAMACGDVDGDGVDDVAISSGTLLRVFQGIPVRR